MSTIPFRKGRYKYIDDVQMVADVIAGNEDAICYLIYERYKVMLQIQYNKVVGFREREFTIEYGDLIQELYIKLRENDWKILKDYQKSNIKKFDIWFALKSKQIFIDQLKHKDYFKKTSNPVSELNDESRIYDKRSTKLAWEKSELMRDIRSDSDRLLADYEPPRDKEIFDAVYWRKEDKSKVAQQYHLHVDSVSRIVREVNAWLVESFKRI